MNRKGERLRAKCVLHGNTEYWPQSCVWSKIFMESVQYIHFFVAVLAKEANLISPGEIMRKEVPRKLRDEEIFTYVSWKKME